MNSISKVKIKSMIFLITNALFASFIILDKSAYISIVLLGLSLLIFVIHAYINSFRINIHTNAFHFFVFAFSCFCIVSSLWAKYGDLAIEKGVTIFEILICMSILFMHFYEDESIERLLKIIAVGGFVVASYCFLYYGPNTIFALVSTGNHMDSDITNQNTIGVLCAFSFIIALYYCYEKIYFALALIPCMLIVAVSTSRKALVLLVLGTLAVLLIRAKSKNKLYTIARMLLIGIIAICLIEIIIKLNIFSGVNERMEGIFAFISGDGNVDNSTRLRQMMIAKGLQQFCETPILGIGIGNAGMLDIGGFSYLHNNYVELLACGGIVGFGIYYSMYIYIIVQLFRYKKYDEKNTKLILSLVILVLIMDYGAVDYYDKTTYFYLMIFFIQISILKRRAHFEIDDNTRKVETIV